MIREILSYGMYIYGSIRDGEGEVDTQIVAFCNDGSVWTLCEVYEEHFDGSYTIKRSTGKEKWVRREFPEIPQDVEHEQ